METNSSLLTHCTATFMVINPSAPLTPDSRKGPKGCWQETVMLVVNDGMTD